VLDERPTRLLLVLFVGGAAGIATALSQSVLIYVGLAAVLIALVLRTPDLGALAVGAYWGTFAIKSIVFSTVIIQGLFYPFYFAFFAAILASLLRGGVRVVPVVFWSFVTFFAFVLLSLIGFANPVDSYFIQVFVTMLICPLVLLSIQSPQGLGTVSVLGGLAGIAISVWVIWEAALGGFSYRGDVDVDQNVAAFVLGLSLTIVISGFIRPKPRRHWLVQLAFLLTSGTMAYALLLLASRGMTIALGISFAAMIIHVAVRDRRVVKTTFLLVAVAGLGLLLPGGDGLLQRFEGNSVGSLGDRTPIWTTMLNALVQSDVKELAIGHGFDSSRQLVRAETTVLGSAHNAYLANVFDYGIIGLLAFLGMHLLVLYRAARLRTPYATLATGIVWLLLGASLTTTASNEFMYWLALGFALACVSVGGAANQPGSFTAPRKEE